MNKRAIRVEFRKKELSYLLNYLVEDLRTWSEKGFESKEEEEQFQHILGVVDKLRKATREHITLFI
ncbi:MAG: hypothetical protein QHH18_07015 [Candidatus Bathyarchaeota archaeon]|jgi:hypothetical protein|nr:hypothetical protein [Candidatus Bathyarchaeota archaeon A05DMB-5]MDH7558331.1 hypothetical protein [Candidatus Bathyarchaeota archaeon]